MTSNMHLPQDFSVRYGQASDAGVKSQNEDCLGIRIPEGEMLATKGAAVVLADGVSAAEMGGDAAEICVQGFLNDYYSTPETWQVETAAHRVLIAINRWLFSRGHHFQEAHKGYVCAMTAAVLKSRTVHLFHVGDARVYLLRDGELQQLTQDHRTWVSSETSYLARAMGLGTNLDIDYRRVHLEAGDMLCLCTDGVHEHISHKELTRRMVAAGPDLDAACAGILKHALEDGSRDNVSCQLIAIDALPDAGPRDVYEKLGRLPFPPPLRPGMVLDGYEVQSVLDESARSQLYLVKDVESGEQAVMKTPAARFSDDAAYIERFLMEEWVGRRVTSPHLVRVLEKRQKPKFLFYLMERVEGQTLDDWMRENPKPEMGVVVDFIGQIVSGVRAMHRKETLHQDLKPDNIIIDAKGCLKIIDYGSAYVAGINESEVPFERQVDLGTRCYSAPEYVLGRRPTTRSDLFSIGVIAYQLLTGGKGHPYGGKLQKAQSVRDFSMMQYVPATTHNPLVPKWIDGAVAKAVSVHPDSRYEVLSAFLSDLKTPNQDFMGAEGLPLIQRSPVAFWKAVSGALGIVVIVLLFLLASR